MTTNDVINFGYFYLARHESLKVNFTSRIGAVLVKKNKSIISGRNQPKKTHPLVRQYNNVKTIHAEFSVIIGQKRNLIKGSTIYIYRETRNGKVANAKPCSMCMEFLKDMEIKKIYHTTSNGYELIKL